MLRDLFLAVRVCAITFVVCAVAYPAAVWGLAQLFFPAQAEGSLIHSADGAVVLGSELIAQKFETPGYFHPRPRPSTTMPRRPAARILARAIPIYRRRSPCA